MKILLRIVVALFFFASVLIAHASVLIAQRPESVPSPTPRAFGTSGFETGSLVAWQQYASSKDNFSASFPKLPVVIRSANWCSTIEKAEYYAYAEGVVYEVSVTSKSKVEPPKQCHSVDQFRPGLLDSRVEQLVSTVGVPLPTDLLAERKTQTFRSDSQTRWVLDDLEHDRWVEIAIHHRPGATLDPEQFLNGLSFTGGSGTEIGDGSAVTLGDKGTANDQASVVKQPKEVPQKGEAAKPDTEQSTNAAGTTFQFTLIAKPRPGYTDEARRAHVQGTVRLRVTFNANGSIGTILALSELPGGLTEQAVKAARKIVFIPKAINGSPESVTKVVEYSFSIY